MRLGNFNYLPPAEGCILIHNANIDMIPVGLVWRYRRIFLESFYFVPAGADGVRSSPCISPVSGSMAGSKTCPEYISAMAARGNLKNSPGAWNYGRARRKYFESRQIDITDHPDDKASEIQQHRYCIQWGSLVPDFVHCKAMTIWGKCGGNRLILLAPVPQHNCERFSQMFG